MLGADMAAARHLESLLARNKQMGRTAERGLLQACYKVAKPSYIWGDKFNFYKLLLYFAVFGSIALPGIVAYRFNSRGLPLPGGAWNLLILVAVVLTWPSFAIYVRWRAIGKRKLISADEFVLGVHSDDVKIDHRYILAIREAIAAAYCIPAELVGPADSRQRMNALSLMSKPLAIEVMADVCRLIGVRSDFKQLRTIEHCFEKHRPGTVAELVRHIDQTMRAARLYPSTQIHMDAK